MALIEAKLITIYAILNFKISVKENYELRMKLKMIYGPEDDEFLILERRN